MSYLVLVRHGESEWNAKGLWTGWKDPFLTPKGTDEARKAGELIKDIPFDIAFTSPLTRVKETLAEIVKTLNISDLQIVEDKAINERDYGDYSGKNKWEIKKDVGDEIFLKIRRSWDYPIPHGESLKQVYDRVVPYYQHTIFPYLEQEKNILVVSSGNALRALVKYLENISDTDISHLEIQTGEVYVYTMNKGQIEKKEIRY